MDLTAHANYRTHVEMRTTTTIHILQWLWFFKWEYSFHLVYFATEPSYAPQWNREIHVLVTEFSVPLSDIWLGQSMPKIIFWYIRRKSLTFRDTRHILIAFKTRLAHSQRAFMPGGIQDDVLLFKFSGHLRGMYWWMIGHVGWQSSWTICNSFTLVLHYNLLCEWCDWVHYDYSHFCITNLL